LDPGLGGCAAWGKESPDNFFFCAWNRLSSSSNKFAQKEAGILSERKREKNVQKKIATSDSN
jgi:hypothetical protein